VHVEVMQAVDDLGPAIAAVLAPEDAVDLDAGPDSSPRGSPGITARA